MWFINGRWVDEGKFLLHALNNLQLECYWARSGWAFLLHARVNLCWVFNPMSHVQTYYQAQLLNKIGFELCIIKSRTMGPTKLDLLIYFANELEQS